MYRGSINDNGRRYVAYKEIDTSESTDGAFEFEFKVAEKLKEFAVPEMYLFKKCPIQDKEPQRIRKGGNLVPKWYILSSHSTYQTQGYSLYGTS